MPHAISEGIQIAYDDMGQGEPALLFMPGWCVNRSVFSDLFHRCGRYRRALNLDWRGHGESGPPSNDYGHAGLVEDAMAVIGQSGVENVIPVALSHAGWVAIELRRRLAERRIPEIIFIDWIVTEPPAAFTQVLSDLQNPELTRQAIDRLTESWIHGVENQRLLRFVRDEMKAYDDLMWARAAREISGEYRRAGSPLQDLMQLEPRVPVLHLYAQPDDQEYLAGQIAFAADHSWYSVQKLHARSHFPMFEAVSEMASLIEDFASSANILREMVAR